jgi:hypothetical protein
MLHTRNKELQFYLLQLFFIYKWFARKLIRFFNIPVFLIGHFFSLTNLHN